MVSAEYFLPSHDEQIVERIFRYVLKANSNLGLALNQLNKEEQINLNLKVIEYLALWTNDRLCRLVENPHDSLVKG